MVQGLEDEDEVGKRKELEDEVGKRKELEDEDHDLHGEVTNST